MYTLYIANKNYSSWSLRPWAVLKACNIPFKEIIIPFHDAQAWEDYKKKVPNKKVPSLVDGQTVIWDSLAITEYLAENYKQVWPEQKEARAWARSAAAQMHSGFQTLRNICSMNCGVRIKLHEVSPSLKSDINQIEELWLQGFEKFKGPFLAGDKFTAVDAFFAPVIFRIQTFNLEVSAPCKQYVKTMLEVPLMKEWYEAALLETWRDLPHDEDTMKAGTITLDLRS